jgi:hypothetical protein
MKPTTKCNKPIAHSPRRVVLPAESTPGWDVRLGADPVWAHNLAIVFGIAVQTMAEMRKAEGESGC